MPIIRLLIKQEMHSLSIIEVKLVFTQRLFKTNQNICYFSILGFNTHGEEGLDFDAYLTFLEHVWKAEGPFPFIWHAPVEKYQIFEEKRKEIYSLSD